MFLTFPFIGFYMGMQFQQELDKPLMREVYKDPESPPIEIPEGTACTMEARLCPDGSYVGRSGPNCEFEKCPGE